MRNVHKSSTADLENEVERLRVQLAGCLTAAEGVCMKQRARRGSYGWSPAYEQVYRLRRRHDALLRALGAVLSAAGYEHGVRD